MATTLPTTIQLKLDQTLAQYRQWQTDSMLEHRPRVIKSLDGGFSNHAFLVEAATPFVVRIDGTDPNLHGLSRQAEWRALQSAGGSGIAPMPRYFNPELGSLVVDYLEPQAVASFDCQGTADLLRAIHALAPLHVRLDLGERLRRYLHQIRNRRAGLPQTMTALERRLPDLLAEIEQLAGQPVLCHNDLLPANRLLSGGRWWALDWEYCAMGNRWFDVAVVGWGEQLSTEQLEQLATRYLAREPTPQERRQLAVLTAIYGLLESAWYLAADLDLEQSQLTRVQAAFSSV
jgi:aminoglycoside phosphotransferase (APT) family kinase protein